MDDRPLGTSLHLRRLLPLALALAGSLAAAGPSAETLEAFERYVRQNDARVQAELKAGTPFLWVDGEPESRRPALYAQLRRGETVVAELTRREARIPDGRVHHWLGLVFLPGVTFRQTEAVVTDYDSYEKFHRPHIVRSRLIRRDGNNAAISLRLYRKKGLTAVLDTEHEVRYTPLDAARGHSRTFTTRVAEVENPGAAQERQRPPGDDRGFLWRHVSYWRFLEKDGGTYVQYESLSLSRDTGAGIGWLVGMFLKGAHKDFTVNMLEGTRKALLPRR